MSNVGMDVNTFLLKFEYLLNDLISISQPGKRGYKRGPQNTTNLVEIAQLVQGIRSQAPPITGKGNLQEAIDRVQQEFEGNPLFFFKIVVGSGITGNKIFKVVPMNDKEKIKFQMEGK